MFKTRNLLNAVDASGHAKMQESVSSILITDRTSEEIVDIIVRRLNNPSNNYRIWWIDKMQRGHDATTLAFIGQMKTRSQPSIKTA